MRTFVAAATLLCASPLFAQSFPPGYVDPAPLLAAAAREIGEAELDCVTFSGTGYAGAVGQTFENAVNIDWPRIDSLANYTRTIDWRAGTSIETFDRKPGLSPASWKYGIGWQGGTPTQAQTRQTHIVNGRHAWHIDGDGEPVAVPPELAELYQLDLWLNPAGFIKAARLPGANPVAFWRWEQLEKGRDGNVVQPEKVHVVAITMLGKYRVDATINSRNVITRIKTTVSEPALGDFNIEHESTEFVDRRQREMADGVALASRLGRQLAVLPPEHRPQRLRRRIRNRSAQRLWRAGARPGVGRGGDVRDVSDVGRARRRRLLARRRAREQLHGRVQRLRRRLRGARQRAAESRRHRHDREARTRQADSLAS